MTYIWENENSNFTTYEVNNLSEPFEIDLYNTNFKLTIGRNGGFRVTDKVWTFCVN